MIGLLKYGQFFFAGLPGVKATRWNISFTEQTDLVLHQGDERRDDDHQTGLSQGRQLITEGFAAARGHNRHGIVFGEEIGDDFPLAGAKLLMAEMIF